MSLSSELYESFRRTYGHILTVVTVGAALSPLYFDEIPSVKLNWVALVVILLGLLLAVFIDYSYRLHNRLVSPLPRIVQSRIRDAPADSKALLLLEPSELFGQGLPIAIYHKDSDFEIFSAAGYVMNVQQNGMIQVSVTYVDPGREQFKAGLEHGHRDVLDNCIVRPGWPTFIADGALSE